MAYKEYKCEKCGRSKRIFFLKDPIRIGITIVGLILCYAVGYSLTDPGLRLVAMYIGTPIASAPLLSILRIRCLHCEPEWKDKIWDSS